MISLSATPLTDTDLEAARDQHVEKHGVKSANTIDSIFDADDLDFSAITDAKKRRELLAAYRGSKKSADASAAPKSISDIDVGAVYAKWNSAGRNAAEE